MISLIFVVFFHVPFNSFFFRTIYPWPSGLTHKHQWGNSKLFLIYVGFMKYLINLLMTPHIVRSSQTAYVSNPETVGTVYFFMVFLVVIIPGLLMVITSVSVVHRLNSRLREKRAEQASKSETGLSWLNGNFGFAGLFFVNKMVLTAWICYFRYKP